MPEEPTQQKKQGVSFREPEKSLHKHEELHAHCKSTPTSLKAATPVKEFSMAVCNVRNTEEAFSSQKHRPAIRRNRGEQRMQEDHQRFAAKRFREKPTKRLPISHGRTAAVDWPKITLTLSLKEKKEDFLIMKGRKLPRRHKKRPKNVEAALKFSTPRNLLPELNKARYEVKEKKSPKKKRPSGLKGMQSMTSDSD